MTKVKGSKSGGQTAPKPPPAAAPAQAQRGRESGPAVTAKPPPPVAAPAQVPPLFRRIDWLAAVIAFVLIWTVYFLTLAPELTLEDSGELATASYYAGIPHPPGYPVWTLYTWLWTVLMPVGNIAWRDGVAEATAGALACGLLALMVSRGSSMLMEGIEELRSMTGKWESAICLVSGLVAGLLVGLDSFMWSESVVVNRVCLFSVPWFLLLLLFLMRWIYAPHQLRYICWALFIFGICFTTHQSLIAASIGIEVTIAVANPRLGCYAFLGNGIIYLIDILFLLATGQHLFASIGTKTGLLFLFHAVGLGSFIISGWLAILTKKKLIELGRDLAMIGAVGYLGGLFLSVTGFITLFEQNAGGFLVFNLVGIAIIVVFARFIKKTWHLGREWLAGLIMGGLYVLGVAFYLYMPIAGMTNPPMQWGYPRTADGFYHALTRGQYEQPNPTDVIHHPLQFLSQIGMLIRGVAEEYSWVYIFIALVPFAFFLKMQKRERTWITCLTSVYMCVGVLLMILMNAPPDKAAQDLIKVFFTSSHTVVAALVGYGLALTAAFMATHYARFRRWGLLGGAIATVLALFCLVDTTAKHYFGPAGQIRLTELPHWIGQAFAKDQYGLPIFANLILVAIALAFVIALLAYRNRAPLLIALGLFATMPLYSGLSHWFNSEQRGHWFGYWFGHDMFTPPFVGPDGKLSYDAKLREQAMKGPNGSLVYPEMTKDAVLFGGTDPGRFCPTYIIFCESFIPHDCQPLQDQKFDRRDVYIITQNALADGTYLEYIRAHYNKSDQVKYDTPFFQEMLRSGKERQENYTTNPVARLVHPLDRLFTDIGAQVEKRRRTSTSLFTDKDFVNLPAFLGKLRPSAQQDPLSKWLYDNLSPEAKTLVIGQSDEARLRTALAKDLNALLERELEIKQRLATVQREKESVDQEISLGSASDRLRREQERLGKEIADLSPIGPLYQSDRFAGVKLSDYVRQFIAQNPQSDTRIRLNRLLLEEAYPGEIARSIGGVYPDREIYIPTPADSSSCFNEYYSDAIKRLTHDQQFPNEARQIKPGEDVKVVPQGGQQQVQVAGQVAVMSINGLLTKVIFDHNPGNEFFVEESFPLDWMYPYLTPFGVIMKINRNPLPDLTEDTLKRDHEFWKQYSKRLCGDIMDYDTPVKQVVEWIEKTYLRHDFNGFTGDRKFIRDSDGQKSFSKLRSSIGGIYAWRVSPQGTPPEYRPKTPEQFQRVYREADFAFKQAFAFCPYSPEAVFRYAQLLSQFGRLDDALLVAQTCLKLDPYNGAVADLVNRLSTYKKQQADVDQARNNLQRSEEEVRANPTNFQAAFNLASIYIQLAQTDRAVQTLDRVLNDPHSDYKIALGVAQAYRQLAQTDRAVQTLDRVLNDPGVGSDAVLGVAQMYNEMANWPKLEGALEKLIKFTPQNPEASYDLARLKLILGKTAESLQALSRALDLSAQRLRRDPTASNLLENARKDPTFSALRQSPEFQKLVPPQ